MKRYVLGLLVVSLLFLVGCTSNPATGRRQLLMMSAEEEIALGEEAMPELIAEYGGEVQSAELREFFDRVGQRLARKVEEPYQDLPWQFTLLDSDVINAFALPGGKVFMTRALLSHMTNEAQVAGVLGHEIGHVTSQHADEQISRQMGASILANLLMAAAQGGDYAPVVEVVVGVGGQGYLLKFNRDQEYEADKQGLKYMTKAGYDPYAMIDVLEILLKMGGSSGMLAEFFSTHPDTAKRLDRVENMLEDDYSYAQANPDYKTYESRFAREVAPRLPKPQ